MTFSAQDTREWLVTNGLGSFASGAITGANTRRYHGLLFAALEPPVERTLLLSRIDEVVGGEALATNHWAGGATSPDGYKKLLSFTDLPVPTWVFAVRGGHLVKQVAMEHGKQQVTIGYTWHPSPLDQTPIDIELAIVVNARGFHGNTRQSSRLKFEQVLTGSRLTVRNSFRPDNRLHLQFSGGEYTADGAWYRGYYWPVEYERGQDDREDGFRCGFLRAKLQPGASLAINAGIDDVIPDATIEDVVGSVAAYQADLLKKAGNPVDADVRRLVLAADTFVVHRNSTNSGSIIAGYHWFNDWGRDSMISMPGLTLSTGRADQARSILSTFRQYLSGGMLPNNFPDHGRTPDYNTADATLLWAWAMAKYVASTKDIAFIRESLPDMKSVVDWHLKGTRYNLHVDPADGLITGGANNVQLTWMDAKCGDFVVTPRRGKPVEINALWYNYLMVLADLCRRANVPGRRNYQQLAKKVKTGFAAFWNDERGCLYDVINEDGSKDASVRPNQLFALSLQHELISRKRAESVLWVVESELLTPHGLRSLSPYDPQYHGIYGTGLASADQYNRDITYHQGTVWSWLIGPWVDARMRVHGKTPENVTYVKSRLAGLRKHLLADGCVGNISEIFDGDSPHTPRGCIAQAWGVAELLRVLVEYPELV